MELLLPAQTWIGRHTELTPSWAQAWRAHSSKPWGHAWVHFIQALAAADTGRVGLAARAEASGLGLDEAKTIEADWSAVHGVQWRESSPPLWAEGGSLSEVLVPTPPVPWRELRMRWQARHPRTSHTSAWAILQWALQVVSLDPDAARPCSMKQLRAVLDLGPNTLSRGRAALVEAGLLADHRVEGRSNTMSWPTPFAGGELRRPTATLPRVEPAPPSAHSNAEPLEVVGTDHASAGEAGAITAADRFMMESAIALARAGIYARVQLGTNSYEFNAPAPRHA